MAKLKDAQPPLIPTTPEELAALSAQSTTPKSALHQTTGQLPVKGETPVPAALKGAQGELLTGMPPKAPEGPQTPVPIELQGAQGELLTQQPQPAAVVPPVDIPSSPPAPAPVTPQVPAEVSGAGTPTAVEEASAQEEAQKPDSPDWLKKLGIVAKNTGRGILELLADFAHGYSGQGGMSFSEAKTAREHEEKIQANERAFAEKLQKLQQDWQAAQSTARNAEDLEQQRRAIEAQAAQAEADRQAGAQESALTRASQERIAGIRTGGAMPGEDPAVAYLRQLFGGGK